jgi:glutamate synthase domain-containing protein 1
MYSDTMKNCLEAIKVTDAQVHAEQLKYDARDGHAEIELYISSKRISYRVRGDAYITSMVKWLQVYLSNSNDISELNLNTFIEEFKLPDNKLRNAILMMELIEQLK